MNKVILLGRLTRDPDVRTTQSGMTVARMSLAVDRRSKDKGADFINLVAWDKIATFAGQYLAKGRQILAEGRIQSGSYEKDGHKVYTFDVVCDHIEFADSKPKEGGNKEEVQTEVPF